MVLSYGNILTAWLWAGPAWFGSSKYFPCQGEQISCSLGFPSDHMVVVGTVVPTIPMWHGGRATTNTSEVSAAVIDVKRG